jgi:arylsulfatase A-like enzyme
MGRRLLESLGLGAAVALLFGAWDVRLHHDLAAAMPALALDRIRSFVPAGLGLGAALGALAGLLPIALERGRSPSRRLLAAAGAALAAAGLWHSISSFRHAAWSRLHWNRPSLAAAVLAAAACLALGVAALWIADTRRRRRGGAAPFRRSRTALAALAVLPGLAFLALVPIAMGRRAEGRPSVVIVSLDTLRGDRLGFMGYSRPTSPNLDRFAGEGAVFERASAASSWTLPSHVSLFTGLLPYDHRILHVGQRVRPDLRMLAERFRDAGYRTGAFTGGGYVSWGYGFDQGFEVFRDHDELRAGGPELLAENALAWAREHAHEPIFLFVHSYEPHGPYLHDDFADPADRGRLPESRSEPLGGVLEDPTPEERRYIADLYDGDVLHADRVLGGLLADLRREVLGEGAIVVVTSDHGEDLWDHAAEDIPAHGHTLYEEILHVPLLVWAPGRIPSGCRIASPVSQIDLPRTLLDLAEIDDPDVPGRSFARALLACEEPEPLPVLAEGVRYAAERFSRREGDRKAIVEPVPSDGRTRRFGSARAIELYDLAIDPHETRSLAAQAGAADRALVEEVLRRIRSTERGGTEGTARPISRELEEQLESLGYVR